MKKITHEDFLAVLELAELLFTHDHPEADSYPPYAYAVPAGKVLTLFMEEFPGKSLPLSYKCSHEWQVVEGCDWEFVYQCATCKKTVEHIPPWVERKGTKDNPCGVEDVGYYRQWWDVLDACRKLRANLAKATSANTAKML